MKQITLDEIRGKQYIWVDGEHSCGYDRCEFDWNDNMVKQEDEWIDHANIEEYLREQEFFYIKLQDAEHGENKHCLFDGFRVGETVLVRLQPDEINDHDDKRLQKMDGMKVRLVHYLEDEGFYITDYFVPSMIAESSDWTHYGFMKVFKDDIVKIQEGK